MSDKLCDKLINTAEIIRDLNLCFTPHDDQIPPIRAIFYEGKQYVFLECGRKYGKTAEVIYFLYRCAMTTPNAGCYFIAPFFKQAKEIVWASNRIQNFLLPEMRKKYLHGKPNNTELRVTLWNGSFIKCDGADNFEWGRGINPHAVAYDEFKDHNPKFHEGMEPNLATFRAPIMIIGTPPETDDNHFVSMAESVKEDVEDGAYFNYTSYSNPHLPPGILDKIKRRLIARGEWDVWMREYMAKRVKGGRNAILPMFDRDKHVKPYDETIAAIKLEYRNYKFYCTADPGTATTFAVLFSAIHKYTRKVTHLTEIYATEMRETSARKMWDKIEPILNQIFKEQERWNYTYDEAATWFTNEIMDITMNEIFFVPTRKSSNKKDAGLSLIKDQMLYGFWECTDRCENLMFEIENYVKDDKGKIPKENDHLIDNMRYTNASDNYTRVSVDEPKVEKGESRYVTIEDEVEWFREQGDWTIKALGEDFFD